MSRRDYLKHLGFTQSPFTMSKKRLFQVFDEMNVNDELNKTALLPCAFTMVEAKSCKQGGLVTMGVEAHIVQKIFLGEMQPVLVVMDKQEYHRLESLPAEDYATKLHQSDTYNDLLKTEIKHLNTVIEALKAQQGGWVKAHKWQIPDGIHFMKLISGEVEIRGTGLVQQGVIQLIYFVDRSNMGINDLPKDYEGVYYLDESPNAYQELKERFDKMEAIVREFADSDHDYESTNFAKALHSPECRACKAAEALSAWNGNPKKEGEDG